MKKLITLLLAVAMSLVMVVSFTGCTGISDEEWNTFFNDFAPTENRKIDMEFGAKVRGVGNDRNIVSHGDAEFSVQYYSPVFDGGEDRPTYHVIYSKADMQAVLREYYTLSGTTVRRIYQDQNVWKWDNTTIPAGEDAAAWFKETIDLDEIIDAFFNVKYYTAKHPEGVVLRDLYAELKAEGSTAFTIDVQKIDTAALAECLPEDIGNEIKDAVLYIEFNSDEPLLSGAYAPKMTVDWRYEGETQNGAMVYKCHTFEVLYGNIGSLDNLPDDGDPV